MFSFKVFLLFWVRATGERVAEKESILTRKRYFLKLVLVFSQMRKISNVKATWSAVTSILKKLFQLLGKVITAIIRQLLLEADADEVRC